MISQAGIYSDRGGLVERLRAACPDWTFVDDLSDLVLTDTGAGVDIDYGTGSFELANVANLAAIDASDFIFA